MVIMVISELNSISRLKDFLDTAVDILSCQ